MKARFLTNIPHKNAKCSNGECSDQNSSNWLQHLLLQSRNRESHLKTWNCTAASSGHILRCRWDISRLFSSTSSETTDQQLPNSPDWWATLRFAFYHLHLICHATPCAERHWWRAGRLLLPLRETDMTAVFRTNRHDRLMRLLTVHRVQRHQPWAKK